MLKYQQWKKSDDLNSCSLLSTDNVEQSFLYNWNFLSYYHHWDYLKADKSFPSTWHKATKTLINFKQTSHYGD